MNNEQETCLKEVVTDALRDIIDAESALPGEEREHAQNKIRETMARLNAVWVEVKNQPATPQPTQDRHRRKILW